MSVPNESLKNWDSSCQPLTESEGFGVQTSKTSACSLLKREIEKFGFPVPCQLGGLDIPLTALLTFRAGRYPIKERRSPEEPGMRSDPCLPRLPSLPVGRPAAPPTSADRSPAPTPPNRRRHRLFRIVAGERGAQKSPHRVLMSQCFHRRRKNAAAAGPLQERGAIGAGRVARRLATAAGHRSRPGRQGRLQPARGTSEPANQTAPPARPAGGDATGGEAGLDQTERYRAEQVSLSRVEPSQRRRGRH